MSMTSQKCSLVFSGVAATVVIASPLYQNKLDKAELAETLLSA